MNKNIYLSKQEQMVFNLISSVDIIFNDEIEGLFPNLKPYQINKICSGLSSKGYLHRLKKGSYLVQGKPSDVPIIKNPYRIALTLSRGYIGFSSALRVYDLLDYESFTIFVVTANKSREKRIGEYIIKSVAMGRKAVGMTYFKDIYISSLSKTFFDCFYKPQYCGGYSTVTKALYDVDLDRHEFIKYFELVSDSLCQRTGYIFDLLKEETDKKIPDEVLNYLRERIKTNTKLLPSRRAGGNYIKKWMVLDNLGKENILSWWYHG